MPKNDPTYWTEIPDRESSNPEKIWCRCQCGREKEVWKLHFKYRQSTSCGKCNLRRDGKPRGYKHGGTGTPEYVAYHAMLQRCYNPECVDYPDYGGRQPPEKPITVCDQWRGKNGFIQFITDMKEKPDPELVLDRTDNNGNYEPTNCQWVTKEESARNKRTTHRVTYKEEKTCITAMAKDCGIPVNVVSERIKLGWTQERATTEPVHRNILNDSAVEYILRNYKPNTRGCGPVALGKKFGVSTQVIQRIVAGEIQRYRHIYDEYHAESARRARGVLPESIEGGLPESTEGGAA